MPPLQLSRLRPQINALVAHYQDETQFVRTLLQICENYSEQKAGTNAWLQPGLNMPVWGVPLIVTHELETTCELLAREHPLESVRLADALWAQPWYEARSLAVFLLAKLEPPHQDEFIRRTGQWISAGAEEALISEIITRSSQRLEVINSPAWAELVRAWLTSGEKSIQKTGLQAVGGMVANEGFQNLPLVFDLLAPLASQPPIALQKHLLAVIRQLIARSQAESASFLISVAQLSQSRAAFSFLRKCLPLFNEYFQGEIKRAVS